MTSQGYIRSQIQDDTILIPRDGFTPPTFVVQSLSIVWLLVTPWTIALQAPLSSSVSWSSLKLISIKLVILSNHHIFCCMCECLVASVVSDSLNPIDCNPPRLLCPWGLSQARILEWVAMPCSRGSSQPRDRTQVSRIAGRFFTIWVTREALSSAPPFSFAFSISQHQSLFQWVSSTHQVAKVGLQFQHHSFQWIFRVDFL